jgi:hypothetical protein
MQNYNREKNMNINIEQIPGLSERKREAGEDYKLQTGGVLRIDTNENIPENTANSHWQRYLWWIDQGNKPKPQFTLDELKSNRWREVVQIMNKTKDGGVVINKKVVCSSPEIKSDVHSLLLEIAAGNIKKPTYIIVNKHGLYEDTVELTEEELREVHKLQSKLYDLCYTNANVLKDLIFASKDPSSININQGWPVTPYIE